jgi:hypothetical protein
MVPKFVDQALQDLRERACPSIVARIASEILQPARAPDRGLQRLILQDPAVRLVLSWQQDDGWLAWDFHGAKSMETGIRILCEKGLDPWHPVVQKALHALEQYTDRLERGIGKVGRVLDEKGFGGSQMIRAALFAYAGAEDLPFVRAQISTALDGFRAVTKIRSIDEVAAQSKGRLVFKDDACWPGIYHLRLLALAHGWRSPQNTAMLSAAISRLVKLSPVPAIYVRHGSQLMAPASFAMHDFNPDMESMPDAEWMFWFHRMECLARLGVVSRIPALRAQVRALEVILGPGQGHFRRDLHSPYFTHWGPYTGLMLERDWRSPLRRTNDLTFRSILILHYAHQQEIVN